MRARLIAVGERMPDWVADGFDEYRKCSRGAFGCLPCLYGGNIRFLD